MKKVMLVAAAAMVLGLVGCSKNVDCNCTIEYMGMTQSFELPDQDDCSNPKDLPAEYTQAVNQMGAKLNCKEK